MVGVVQPTVQHRANELPGVGSRATSPKGDLAELRADVSIIHLDLFSLCGRMRFKPLADQRLDQHRSQIAMRMTPYLHLKRKPSVSLLVPKVKAHLPLLSD